MLKAILKKQLMELISFYFSDSKTGKRRGKAGTVGFIVIYLVAFFGFGSMFYSMSQALAAAMLPAGFDWLYFAFMGLIALIFGVFGSVFSSYSGLYQAKDNELLLSMPIPASIILLSRMLSVFLMGLIFEALVFVPAIIAAFAYGSSIVAPVVTLLMLGLIALILSCALGWAVALVSGRLKNKSLVTVILSLVFLGLYFWLINNYYSLLQSLILNVDSVGAAIRGRAYPLYLLGSAASGSVEHLLIFTLVCLSLTFLTWYVLSRSFMSIVSMHGTRSKAVYQEKKTAALSLEKALYRRELRRFCSSPTYMLNCGLGVLLCPVGAAAILIMLPQIREIFSAFNVGFDLRPLFAVAGIVTMTSMIDISAPSVSLEGKNLWVLRSMPVPTEKILAAKEAFHCSLAIPAAVLLASAMAIAIEAQPLSFILLLLFAAVQSRFCALLGLVLNLKFPNLLWSSETVPVKQGISVAACVFGNWLFALVLFGLGYLLRQAGGNVFCLICIALELAACRLLRRWLGKRGCAIFESL